MGAPPVRHVGHISGQNICCMGNWSLSEEDDNLQKHSPNIQLNEVYCYCHLIGWSGDNKDKDGLWKFTPNIQVSDVFYYKLIIIN